MERTAEMNKRIDDLEFLAILVTAIILIFVAGANPPAVKVITDLAAAYWAFRATRNRPKGPEESAK